MTCVCGDLYSLILQKRLRDNGDVLLCVVWGGYRRPQIDPKFIMRIGLKFRFPQFPSTVSAR